MILRQFGNPLMGVVPRIPIFFFAFAAAGADTPWSNGSGTVSEAIAQDSKQRAKFSRT
jgi:hypothetical protein